MSDEIIPMVAELRSKTIRFCSSCGREKIIEGGTWINTCNKKKRWICVHCLFNRTHRISRN